MKHVVMFIMPDGRPQYSKAASYDAACRDAWRYTCLDCVREVEVLDESEARERMIPVDLLLPAIVLWAAYPPIPVRTSDWAAYRDGDEEGRYGWGETPEKAIADLLAWEDRD